MSATAAALAVVLRDFRLRRAYERIADHPESAQHSVAEARDDLLEALASHLIYQATEKSDHHRI